MHCRDGTLLLWLAALVDEIDGRAAADPWLSELRDEWYTQATVGFDGHVEARLDDLVATEEQRAALIALCKGVRAQLAQQGKPGRGSLAHRIGPFFWEAQGASRRVLRVADAFLWLLEGPAPVSVPGR
jgi:hypothetical protein